jgi:hypothetical protein
MCRPLPALALAAVCLAGCSRGHDPALTAARESLQAALDAWKAGAPADGLTARTPPVEFTDDEHRAGHKLLGYEITRVEPYGDVVHCYTDLTVQDRRGQTATRKVVYAVALRDKVVIARDPYF